MTLEIDGEVQFEGDRGVIVTGTVTIVQGREPYRVCGVRGPGASENYLIPERHLRMSQVTDGAAMAHTQNYY